MTPLLSRFRRDIAGIVWLAAGAFIAMALVSFHPVDPSFNSVVSGPGAKHVHNLCGYFGSFLSDILYQALGVAAWVLVVGALRLSFRSFKGTLQPFQIWRLVWGVLLLVVSASLCSLYFPATKIFAGHIPLGGAVGLLVSHGLVNIFNSVGVGIILWATVVVLTIFYTEKPLSELFPWLSKAPALLYQKLQAFFVGFKNSLKQAPRAKEVKIAAQEQLAPLIETPRFSLLEAIKLKKNKNSEEDDGRSPAIVEREAPKPKKKSAAASAPRQIENWQMPTIDLFLEPPKGRGKVDEREISRNAKLVEQKLAEFDVMGQVTEVKPGPAVTMYEFKPAASVKINDITKLNDDLSLALSAESLRIIAPIPGRDVVGIETSNSTRDDIFMKELVEAPDFWSEDIKLPIALGKAVNGDPKIVDLRKIPHLLVAGTTGSGKSVFIMSLVTSLVMRHSPKTLRLILVDPKQVDLAVFHKIPHLLMPAVKEARPAVNTLKWLIREMEKRYRSMSRFGSKNIEGFNGEVSKLTKEQLQTHEEKIKLLEEMPQTAMQSYYCKPQPYIVAVIEEFADLMSVDKNGVEPAVVRLAQMARASGIHLVLAMQSPRREVLTGLIKTNFPGRISFKVASKVDSQVVLDQRGAERLLAVGDMLYLAPGVSQPQRYHGAFLRDEEMNRITDFWMQQGEPQFEPTALNIAEDNFDAQMDLEAHSADKEEGYDEVVAFVSSQKEVSASLLQRRFRFGYPKAARIIELLETEGVVGPSNGSKPRQVLVNRLD